MDLRASRIQMAFVFSVPSVSRACRSAAYWAAPRQAKTVKQLKKECRYQGGRLDARVSGTSAGRSVLHLTSPLIGLLARHAVIQKSGNDHNRLNRDKHHQ